MLTLSLKIEADDRGELMFALNRAVRQVNDGYQCICEPYEDGSSCAFTITGKAEPLNVDTGLV